MRYRHGHRMLMVALSLLLPGLPAAAVQPEAGSIQSGPWLATADAGGGFTLDFRGRSLIVAAGGYVEHTGGRGKGTVAVEGHPRRLVFASGSPQDVCAWRQEVILSPSQCLILVRVRANVTQPRAGEVHFFLSPDTLDQVRYELRTHDSAGLYTCTLDRKATDSPPPFARVRQALFRLPVGSIVVEPACQVEAGGAWYFQPTSSGGGRFRLVAVPHFTPERKEVVLAVRLRTVAAPERWLPNATEVELAALAQEGYAVTSRQGRRYVLRGAKATVRLEGVSATASGPLAIRYRWLDPYGAPVRTGQVRWARKPGESAAWSIPLTPGLNGVYRLEASWPRPEGGTGRTEALMACLPSEPARQRAGLSYFGGISGVDGPFPGDRYFYRLARDAGTGFLRTHDATYAVTWPYVEPEPGKWVWDDAPFDAAQRLGFQVMGTLGGFPKWLDIKDADDYLRPDVLDAWGRYVETTVRHYGDRVKYWEVLNEPYWLFAQTYQRPDVYARLLEVACAAVRRADPTAVVVGTCGPPRDFLWQWYDQTFALGSLRHQDVVSVHFYPSGFYNLPADFDLTMGKWYVLLRDLLRKHGRALPLVSTEGTNGTVRTFYRLPQQARNASYGDIGKPQAPARAAQTLVRTYLANMQWGAGYSWHCMYFCSGLLDGHTVEYDGTPMPLLVAHAALTRQLGDAVFAGRLVPHARVQGLVWRRGQDAIATFFPFGLGEKEAGTLLLPGGRQVLLHDLYGNPGPYAEGRLPLKPDGFWYVTLPGTPAGAAAKWLAGAKVTGLAGKARESRPDPRKQGLEPVPIGQSIRDLFIDLKPFCNADFVDESASDGKGGWTDQGSNDLRQLPHGVWASGPAHFLILDPKQNGGRSCVVFRGGPLVAYPDGYPREVRGLQVGEKLVSLDLLHGAAWTSMTPGDSVALAKVTVHYASGARQAFEVQAGQHLLDWWTNVAGPLPGGGEVAWRGANPEHDPILLYRHRWKNPTPDDPITTLDIEATGSGVYGLISLTGTKGVP